MDIATLLGLLGALGSIGLAIFMGGSAGMFVNGPGLLIVVAGTLAVILMKFPLSTTLKAFSIALKAFFHKSEDPNQLIDQAMELALIARKEGLLGLESAEVSNSFLKRGISYVVDGFEPEVVRGTLSKDINMTIERHEQGQSIFKSIADVAPAMGMIGTLIGLVQMMANMDDPKAIGPAMAVALLTTLYGAIIANALAQPIADKLAIRSNEERMLKYLVLESIDAIQEGMNPRMMEGLLKTFLPENKRDKEVKDAA
ncbi:MAG TPA: flagellar motor protein PomA [Gammaproteobacteria bacterium]|nr:flagellar motor protein PomA [Gammaproteobacteria bacterium]